MIKRVIVVVAGSIRLSLRVGILVLVVVILGIVVKFLTQLLVRFLYAACPLCKSNLMGLRGTCCPRALPGLGWLCIGIGVGGVLNLVPMGVIGEGNGLSFVVIFA